MTFLQKACAYFLIGSAAASGAEALPGVQFENIPEVGVSQILERFPSLKTSTPRLSDLNLAAKIFLNEFKLDTVVIEQSDSGIKIRGELQIRVGEIRFQGHHEFNTSELKREIAWQNDLPPSPSRLKEAQQRLKKVYEDRGYFQTAISLHLQNVSPRLADLVVKISEGKQTRIRKVFVESQYPEIVEMLSRFTRQYRNEPLRDTVLSEMHQRLKSQLSQLHLYRAEIQDPVLEHDDSNATVDVRWTLSKDEQHLIEYKGNTRFSKSELEEALGLESFASTNPSIAPELSLKLKNFYLSRGFARVEVNFEEPNASQNWQRKLIFEIREGVKVRIKDVQFVGRNETSNEVLVRRLQKLSSPMIADGIFVRSDLDQALENLKIERQNLGFLKARLISTRVSYSREKDSVNIVINFDEGPQTRIESVRFEGNASFPEAQLVQLVGLQTGEPLLLNHLDDALNRLRRFYLSAGFLDFRVLNDKENLISFNEDNTSARLIFKVSEGPMVRVGPILVEGNSLTRTKVILKELEFQVGDVLTPQKLEESSSRLQRLGHFTSVEIRTLEEQSSIANRTVLVRVQDRDPGLFNVGVGASNERDFTLRGYTGVAYRNIRGSGRAASVRLEGKYNVAQIRTLEGTMSLGYLEPYLWDSRVRARTNYTQSVLVTNYDRLLATETRQFILSLEQDLDSHILLSWDLVNFARYKDYSLKSEADFPTNLTDISTTGPSINWDYRDHPFNPSKGTFSQLTLEYAHPAIGSTLDIEFFKATGGSTLYWEVTRSMVWANSLRGGYLQNRKLNGSVPYDKVGFQIGGLKSVRGFQPGETYPNRREFESDSYRMSTQAVYGLVKSELRFPLLGNLGGAVFYDGGYVSIQNLTLPLYYRDAVGVGIRYNTPLGPLTIDYGWKLNRMQSRDENDGVVHLSIGSF